MSPWTILSLLGLLLAVASRSTGIAKARNFTLEVNPSPPNEIRHGDFVKIHLLDTPRNNREKVWVQALFAQKERPGLIGILDSTPILFSLSRGEKIAFTIENAFEVIPSAEALRRSRPAKS